MVASFIITVREALEAALIVAIIMAYLGKIGRRDLYKYLYLGTGVAALTSVLLGSLVFSVYGGLPAGADNVFEGVASITATLVLTYMIFWMAQNARNIRNALQEQITVAVTTGQVFGIASLAFVSVFREGLETALFLTALAVTDLSGTLVGMLLGLGGVLILAVLTMRGVYRINIQTFFKYTSVLLVVFAAGLLSYGVHEFIEAGLVPPLIDPVWNINPPDATHPFHENGAIGSLLKALIGYDGNPELLRVIVYVGYWLVIGYYLLRTYAPGYLRVNNNHDEARPSVQHASPI
jgi:high-affinity iron transporter